MRVSRTRFFKRRSKRKTEFPIVAVVQKKRKPEYNKSHSFSILGKETNQRLSPTKPFYEDEKTPKLPSSKDFIESDQIKKEALQQFSFSTNKLPGSLSATQRGKEGTEKRNFAKPQRKSRATIDYKNVILLRNLITAEGKILPRRINKLTAKQQRSVQKAIKSARIMGLLPFINKSRPFS